MISHPLRVLLASFGPSIECRLNIIPSVRNIALLKSRNVSFLRAVVTLHGFVLPYYYQSLDPKRDLGR